MFFNETELKDLQVFSVLLTYITASVRGGKMICDPATIAKMVSELSPRMLVAHDWLAILAATKTEKIDLDMLQFVAKDIVGVDYPKESWEG
jgi:hypothetical protein